VDYSLFIMVMLVEMLEKVEILPAAPPAWISFPGHIPKHLSAVIYHV
jgi:hypothetical protein